MASPLKHMISMQASQKSVLGRSLFMIYVNDLTKNILKSFVNIYANDMTANRYTSKNLIIFAGLSSDLTVQWESNGL